MANHLALYSNTITYNYELSNGTIIKPNVSYCEDTLEVHYNPLVKPKNIITYNAPSKLVETTSSKNSGLHTNAFNCAMVSHTFENGVGTVEFESDVTSIGGYAFYGCSGLTNIDIPNSVEYISEQAFFNCTSLSTITIPNSVRYIEKEAFKNTLWFNNQPNGVVYINSIAYKYKGAMPSQTSIEIPSGVTRINDLCFSNCENLSSITIPSSVTSIGDLAFGSCTELGTITSFAITAPTIISNNLDTGNGTFIGMYSGTLYVPIGSSGYDTWMSNLPSGWTKVEQ